MSQTAPGASTDTELTRYRSLRNALVWLAGMLLLTYLASVLTLPWKAVSLVFAVTGIVFGVLALVRTARIPAPWVLRVGAVAGMAGCALFGFVAASQVVFWDATTRFEDCTAGAITERALEQCSQEYTEQLAGFTGPVGAR
ncbi:MAG: hypothetical protein MOP51_1854 [Citricoccus sp.]|nr:hypothetical protein [Citricoccus sp. WCRC_4]